MGKVTPETFAYYLSDLGKLIREDALKAKKDRDMSKTKAEQKFNEGRLMAYNEVISLMQQQANAFGLSFKEIALDGIDPDNDLV